MHILSDAINFCSFSFSYVLHYNCRIILLHGLTGTGKTSLCKALAQKLSIRFKSRSVLIEILICFLSCQ
jgi:SpoVK/Ycf46/Vps4 family AAA+-type ATPase